MRAKDIIPAEKPRNFVAKNAMKTTSGAGQHTDKKQADKQGNVKHKGKEYAEGMAEGRNTNNPVDDMVEDYLDWLGARHMLTKRREEEKAQIMSDLKSGYLHPDDIDYAMSSGQGMAKETGDKPFDNMMKKVTKTPTAKARNTERIRQKREREEETRDRLKGGFGLSPADKLSIREPKESSSGAMANAASRLVNKDDGKVAKLRAAGDKRREDQLKSRNIAKKNEDAASVAESDPSGLMHAARHLNKEFRITAEVDGVAKRARVQAQSSRTAQEKFMKRYPTAQIHNVEDITQQMSETGVAEGGFFDPDRPNIGNVVKHKHSGAMGRVKKIGTQGGTTTVYFKDAKTGAMNYGEWKKHVFPIKKQGVAEGSFGSGYGRVFTLYVNTGEKPPTKTKTKKFKREDDAVAWAEDYADTHDQYPTLQMEIKDDNGGVVWELEESQGVAEVSNTTLRSYSKKAEKELATPGAPVKQNRVDGVVRAANKRYAKDSEEVYGKVKESLRRGEYYVHTVHFADGETGQIKTHNDEQTDDSIKAFYAKQGKDVVKVDYNWGIQGEQDY